jgi:FHA domain-containing protein
MATHSDPRTSSGAHRPARDLIDAVIESMRANLEPLKYSTLAPSRYLVYLHPEEFARLEGIMPLLQDQTARALSEELQKLNSRPAYRKYFDRVRGAAPPVENAAREWQVEFLPDHDGEVAVGDILIHSELVLPTAPEELGAGQRTRRITTVHAGRHTTKREETVTRTQPASDKPYACLRFEDNAGAHTFDIVRDSVTIGRGGIAYRADVRIDASVDVSREHARIRRDLRHGTFFIVDLSTLGTTVNGVRLPRGYEDAGGTKRENGVETPLTTGSRIGLADTIYLDFEILRR